MLDHLKRQPEASGNSCALPGGEPCGHIAGDLIMRLLNELCFERQTGSAHNHYVAFMFAMVLLFTGGAVDFSRRNAVQADLI
ncbi:MAG: hypothetical protein R3C42_04405 [Parvularculaceae bacterium]